MPKFPMRQAAADSLTRRDVLRGGAALGATFALPRFAIAESVGNPLRIAVVGLRGRGRSHIRAFTASAGAQVAALVDVDRGVLAKTAERLAADGLRVDTETDLRRVLERDDIDAISIATPNHWHSLQAIWACQAGKHVYLEKPISHNVWEGRQLVRAAEKYGTVVQCGTQIRSNPSIQEAMNWIHEGNLGEIQCARGLCYKPRKSIGKVNGPQPVDPAVDFDLWTGPAPLEPLRRERLHYDWHWQFNTGNGDLGNQGIHQMDLARWALGETKLAPTVVSVGGRFGYDDDGNTPNSQVVYHGYEKAPLIFEVRGLPKDKPSQGEAWNDSMDSFQNTRIGLVVHCEHGTLQMGSYTEATAFDLDGEPILHWKGGRDQLHYDNFVQAATNARPDDLNGPIEEGHLSSALCHLGNVSYLEGESVSNEQIAESCGGYPYLIESLERLHAHLVSNGVDFAQTPATLGARLDIDPKTETLRGNAEAAHRLTRKYREGFEVPSQV